MKIDGKGQASVFEGNDFTKLMSCLSLKYALIFRIAYYTAGRTGEVVRLPASCVYSSTGEVLPEITYWSEITKDQETRAVPVASSLKFYLEHYWNFGKPQGFYLFPGKHPDSHLQFQSADDALRRAIKKAGLSDKGYSCHSFRRSAITRMSEAGTSLKVVQEITGHDDLKNLQRYIDVTTKQKEGAIATL